MGEFIIIDKLNPNWNRGENAYLTVGKAYPVEGSGDQRFLRDDKGVAWTFPMRPPEGQSGGWHIHIEDGRRETFVRRLLRFNQEVRDG